MGVAVAVGGIGVGVGVEVGVAAGGVADGVIVMVGVLDGVVPFVTVGLGVLTTFLVGVGSGVVVTGVNVSNVGWGSWLIVGVGSISADDDPFVVLTRRMTPAKSKITITTRMGIV